MLFSITGIELFDILVMTLIMGFLFKDSFGAPRRPQRADHDPLQRYLAPRSSWWKDLWFAAGVIAPSVILHELAHKFTAIAFGLSATFHAFYADTVTFFLGVIAIVMKLTGMGLVFMVPGFVEIQGATAPANYALIAFAGPAVHGLFWLGALLYLKTAKKPSPQALHYAHLTKYINGFLFILNMLPIPGIDGFGIYSALWQAFIG
jgi:Zn-dependent protease